MIICDHEFFPTKYSLVTPYDDKKVNPEINVQCCRCCGVLRLSDDDMNELRLDYLTF